MVTKISPNIELEISTEEYSTIVRGLRHTVEYGYSYEKDDARNMLRELGESVEEEYN